MEVFNSFRDPDGSVLLTREHVWRFVNNDAALWLKDFLQLKAVTDWQQKGNLIGAVAASDEQIDEFQREFGTGFINRTDQTLFTHPRIDFPSFACEWAPEMLYDAGLLTLDLAEDLFAQTGWSIKDATPYNILFQGTNPVFVDILSFEKRSATNPLWLAYNQFLQTFLLPLLVNKEIGLSLNSIFLSNRDGLQISEVNGFFGKTKKLKPNVLSLVTVPHLLSKKAESSAGLYTSQNLKSAEKAEFILKQTFRRLRKQLKKVAPTQHRQSKWTDYTAYNQETIPDYMQAKHDFVCQVLDKIKPSKVLDAGCNTGIFSFAAARAGANVTAIDYDPTVIGQVYQTVKREKLSVLPLVVNLSRPTPALGWRFSENPSFLDRALGHFDLVMMLAVIHHMLVQERIPLREILKLAADLTKDWLIIEFVPPSDKLFKRLARGREHLHSSLTEESFAQTAAEFFTIVRSEKLPDTERRLYLMKRK